MYSAADFCRPLALRKNKVSQCSIFNRIICRILRAALAGIGSAQAQKNTFSALQKSPIDAGCRSRTLYHKETIATRNVTIFRARRTRLQESICVYVGCDRGYMSLALTFWASGNEQSTNSKTHESSVAAMRSSALHVRQHFSPSTCATHVSTPPQHSTRCDGRNSSWLLSGNRNLAHCV